MAAPAGRFDERTRAFLRLMVSRDDFTVVIKGAAYVEIAVKEFIEAHLARPEDLENVHLDHFDRCALAVALGLDPEFHSPLKALGKLRNTLAHQPEATTLTKGEVNNLYKALPPEMREMVSQLAKKVAEDSGKEKFRFTDTEPLSVFQFIVVVLRGGIYLARAKVVKARSS